MLILTNLHIFRPFTIVRSTSRILEKSLAVSFAVYPFTLVKIVKWCLIGRLSSNEPSMTAEPFLRVILNESDDSKEDFAARLPWTDHDTLPSILATWRCLVRPFCSQPTSPGRHLQRGNASFPFHASSHSAIALSEVNALKIQATINTIVLFYARFCRMNKGPLTRN